MIRGLSAVPVRRMTIQSEWRGMRWPSRCALAGDGAPERAKADGAVGAADGAGLSENGVIVYVLL
jgi:hypothetical protein